MGGMREEDVVFCSVQLSLSAQATDQQWHIIADSSHQAAPMMIFTSGFWGPQSFSDFKAKNRPWRFITTVSYKPAATTAGSDGRFTLFRGQYNWVIWAANGSKHLFERKTRTIQSFKPPGRRHPLRSHAVMTAMDEITGPFSSLFQVPTPMAHRFSKNFPKFPENCFVFLADGRLVSYTHVSLLSGESSFDDYTITGV